MLTAITMMNNAVYDVYLIEHVTIAILEWRCASAGSPDYLKWNGRHTRGVLCRRIQRVRAPPRIQQLRSQSFGVVNRVPSEGHHIAPVSSCHWVRLAWKAIANMPLHCRHKVVMSDHCVGPALETTTCW